VRREGTSLVVTVEDDGTGERRPAMPTGGHGLAGLRERVDLFGGCLTAGAGPSGWRLEATIPLPARGAP
jgi:signal transduction histidine kinase